MGYYGSNGRGFFSNIPVAVKNIILINILVYVLTLFTGDFMYEKFALFYVESPFFHWWQPVTHMFMHGGFFHIFFNMYTLLIFGCALERIWGPKKFLLFYFVTGIGAALLHTGVMALQAEHFKSLVNEGVATALQGYYDILRTPTVGASGAIYGVLLGYGMLFPNDVLQLLFPPVALKAKWFVLIFAVIELATGVLGTRDGIAHFAHLGGMIFGLIMILIWKKKNRLYYEG